MIICSFSDLRGEDASVITIQVVVLNGDPAIYLTTIVFCENKLIYKHLL